MENGRWARERREEERNTSDTGRREAERKIEHGEGRSRERNKGKSSDTSPAEEEKKIAAWGKGKKGKGKEGKTSDTINLLSHTRYHGYTGIHFKNDR
jgi:hypothetical protein